mmetsp:Transcript_48699/g.141096  ORF Transcript_48699/g.141096 Transcript_48699/m.141096 type:complete len:212 (-) Transcript_48699:117-752(-)
MVVHHTPGGHWRTLALRLRHEGLHKGRVAHPRASEGPEHPNVDAAGAQVGRRDRSNARPERVAGDVQELAAQAAERRRGLLAELLVGAREAAVHLAVAAPRRVGRRGGVAAPRRRPGGEHELGVREPVLDIDGAAVGQDAAPRPAAVSQLRDVALHAGLLARPHDLHVAPGHEVLCGLAGLAAEPVADGRVFAEGDPGELEELQSLPLVVD